MTREEAIRLVHEMVAVEAEVTKKVNSGSGRISIALEKRERKAAEALFKGLTGLVPYDAEIVEMVSL